VFRSCMLLPIDPKNGPVLKIALKIEAKGLEYENEKEK